MPRTWNSSNSSSDENESDDQSYDVSHLNKELNKLKPYDYEPLASSSDEAVEDNESDTNNPSSRRGEKCWCTCGHCDYMETENECWCCQEANEISDEIFKGIFGNCLENRYYLKEP